MASSRMRIALSLAAASAAAVACSAIVGVEDVTLARGRDAEAPPDDAEVESDGQVTDASKTTEASVQLAVGYLFTCARNSGGKVRCWGDNGAGQLGDGISFEAGARPARLVPQDVAGVDDAIELASGLAHACAIRRAGTVTCWGVNSFGQLGEGTTQRSSSAVPVGGVTDAVALAAGTSFTCALIRGGTVQCWGANYSGQLGDGTKVSRGTAAPVNGITGATAIAAGEHHACAVVDGGGVKCWGKNDEGQLGNGSTMESLAPAAVSIGGVVQIVAASRFTCARLASGQVSCWGANTLGQLGSGSPNAAPNPSPIQTTVSDGVSIWVGYEHACAARKNGQVSCWGQAGSGQVGSGSVPEDASVPRPTAVVGVTGALAVGTGGDHSCATTSTGAVFCWGANSLGQLGDGTTQRAYAAVAVKDFP